MRAAELEALLAAGPVIAAIKDMEELDRALASEVRAVFILFGDILSVEEITARIVAGGKSPFVHIDLIEGLSQREVAVDFMARHTSAAGIISTRPAMIARAKELGLIAIQRFFLLDSRAIKGIERQLAQKEPADFIEVLPGLMPKIIHSLVQRLDKPVIAGGLISDKEDVVAALGAGALAVSSTNEAVWSM